MNHPNYMKAFLSVADNDVPELYFKVASCLSFFDISNCRDEKLDQLYLKVKKQELMIADEYYKLSIPRFLAAYEHFKVIPRI